MVREIETSKNSDTEQVILVHGTFASSAEDHGKAWWQIGSPAHQELGKRLPPGVELASQGDLFRWSGDNTERARSKAARNLLVHLEHHEQAGRPYHLVGHSHGGSVIWTALRLATARGKTLSQLRSWSTVGTPFMHHRSRSPWNPLSLVYMVLAVGLLYPAWRCFMMLATMPYHLITGQMNDGFIMKSDKEVGFIVAMVRTPAIKGLELLGVPFTPTETGLRIGSFDPMSGESAGHFLFFSLEGWLILGAIAMLGYITLLLGSFFMSSVSEGLRIAWEKRVEQRAFLEYRNRWLGLWTRDDEAINGLRATLKLTVSFIGNLVVRERVYFSDVFALPSRPIFKLFAPIYNRIIRPVLDSKIREIVVKTAQGNDRPSAEVVAVSPHPVLPPPAPSAPPLPEDLQSRILKQADSHANDLGPKLRVLLSQPSLTTGLEGFSQTLSGSELVHTSYFDHAAVMDLLSMNIGWGRGKHRIRRAASSSELTNWFHEFKRLQTETNLEQSDEHDQTQESSIAPAVQDPKAA